MPCRVNVNDGRIQRISQLLLGTMADTGLSQSDRSGAGVGKECCSSVPGWERQRRISYKRARTEDGGYRQQPRSFTTNKTVAGARPEPRQESAV